MKLNELEKMIQEAVQNKFNEALDVTEDIYQSIVSIVNSLGDELVLGKKAQLRRLSALSATHYQDELGRLYEFFPRGTMGNPIPKPDNYEDLLKKTKRQLDEAGIKPKKNAALFSGAKNPILDVVGTPNEAYWITLAFSPGKNDGARHEDAIIAYCNKIGPRGVAREVGGTAAGQDVVIDGVVCEVKSSEGGDPNYNLNSSVVTPDPDKAYLFITNTSSTPIVYVVSSDLLYKLITFRLVKPGEDLETSIQKDVEEILGTVNLSDMVIQTIITGKPYEVQKSFNVGNSPISARFRLMFNLSKFK